MCPKLYLRTSESRVRTPIAEPHVFVIVSRTGALLLALLAVTGCQEKDRVVPQGQAAEVPRFEPAPGWDTVTIQNPAGDGGFAMTANIPLAASDRADELPREAIERLPAQGALLHAHFWTPREAARRQPRRTLPLRLAEAERVGLEGIPDIPTWRITAATNDYDVDVLVFFGSANPAQSTREAADAALGRLVPPN